MRASAAERTIGRINERKALVPGILLPIRKLQNIEIIVTTHHAAIGMRFHEAAWA
jgi:hypothetical protein